MVRAQVISLEIRNKIIQLKAKEQSQKSIRKHVSERDRRTLTKIINKNIEISGVTSHESKRAMTMTLHQQKCAICIPNNCPVMHVGIWCLYTTHHRRHYERRKV